MRFVPVRSVEQQATTVIHKVREMLVKQRTMITNSLRGLLAEFGVTVPEGTRYVSELTARVADPEDTTIPAGARVALSGMIEVLNTLNEQIATLETRIRVLVRENEGMRRLQTIPGVGPILASALVAIVTDPRHFDSGRDFAASYQATHVPTVLAQLRVAIDLIWAGAAISLFHASQQASTMASYVTKTRLLRSFCRRNSQMFSTGLSSGE